MSYYFEFRDIFREYSSKEAVIYGNRTLTYSDLENLTVEMVNNFQKNGVQKNERIAVVLNNDINFVICYYACIYGNFTIVPVNPSLPQKDIDFIIKLSSPKLIVKATESGMLEFQTEKKTTHTNLDLLGIFFTSGTTGQPKGVCHSVENMLANAVAFNTHAHLDSSMRMLHVLPMAYMAGFLNTLLSPFMIGGTVILAPQFDAGSVLKIWDTAMSCQANTTWLTPTMVALLTKLCRSSEIEQWAHDNLHNVFIGTAPLPKTISEGFEKKFCIPCLESYGMSELLLVSANTRFHQHKAGSVGRVISGVKIESRQGETGSDLWIKTPFALAGYINPDTGEIYTPLCNDWFDTGDIGYVDRDGSLYITGRAKDLIIHGGTNVSPRAVEETLLQYQGVSDASVIGIENDFWGEEVIAFILTDDDCNLDASDLSKYCRENLSSDAVPNRFIFLSEFPRSITGKVQKNLLKDML